MIQLSPLICPVKNLEGFVWQNPNNKVTESFFKTFPQWGHKILMVSQSKTNSYNCYLFLYETGQCSRIYVANKEQRLVTNSTNSYCVSDINTLAVRTTVVKDINKISVLETINICLFSSNMILHFSIPSNSAFLG